MTSDGNRVVTRRDTIALFKEPVGDSRPSENDEVIVRQIQAGVTGV